LLSKRNVYRYIPGKGQLFINAFAKALEVIPRQLCDNSGFDATDVLNKLRQKHALTSGEGVNFGVDVNTGGIIDTYEVGACTNWFITGFPCSLTPQTLPNTLPTAFNVYGRFPCSLTPPNLTQ
jgi:chaperonin GroEL (HSP60 family)